MLGVAAGRQRGARARRTDADAVEPGPARHAVAVAALVRTIQNIKKSFLEYKLKHLIVIQYFFIIATKDFFRIKLLIVVCGNRNMDALANTNTQETHDYVFCYFLLCKNIFFFYSKIFSENNLWYCTLFIICYLRIYNNLLLYIISANSPPFWHNNTPWTRQWRPRTVADHFRS